MANKISTDINRVGSFKGATDYCIPMTPTTGSSMGSLGTGKFEGGLKKGAAGIPAMKKSK
jgi:hypothetical protein